MICNNQYSKPRSIDVFATASQHWHTTEARKNFRRCHCETVEPSFLLCQEAPWPLGRAVDGCMVRCRPNPEEHCCMFDTWISLWFRWSGNSDSHLIVLSSFLRIAFVRYCTCRSRCCESTFFLLHSPKLSSMGLWPWHAHSNRGLFVWVGLEMARDLCRKLVQPHCPVLTCPETQRSHVQKVRLASVQPWTTKPILQIQYILSSCKDMQISTQQKRTFQQESKVFLVPWKFLVVSC